MLCTVSVCCLLDLEYLHVETNIYKQTAEEAVILKAEPIW